MGLSGWSPGDQRNLNAFIYAYADVDAADADADDALGAVQAGVMRAILDNSDGAMADPDDEDAEAAREAMRAVAPVAVPEASIFSS